MDGLKLSSGVPQCEYDTCQPFIGGHFLRGVLLGGVSLRVIQSDGYLLGSLGFWFLINKETLSLLGFYLDVFYSKSFSLCHYPSVFCVFWSSSFYRPFIHYLGHLLHLVLWPLQWLFNFSIASSFSPVLVQKAYLFPTVVLETCGKISFPYWFSVFSIWLVVVRDLLEFALFVW